jgi:adenine-specific DNA-methyltransferase
MKNPALISKIKSLEALTAEEKAELIALLNNTKKYGLVWEDKPEAVEELLRKQLPVLQEVPERRILARPAETNSPKTEKANNLQQTLFDQQPTPASTTPASTSSASDNPEQQTTNTKQQTPNTEQQTKNNEQQTTNTEQQTTNTEQKTPNHILIEGDNLHALTALSFTHEGKIDVIYIDPPYNTGNKDFKYNDSFVDREDSYRHSKWLSFMKKRLEIAKRLMSEKGVIFISIDDNEQAQLKLLCDEIFYETSCIGNVIWQHSVQGKNDAKTISLHHNYTLIYSKSDFQIGKIPRTELHNKAYSNHDNDPKGLWRSGDVRSPNYRENLCFIINTPLGKKIKPPTNGWRWEEKTLKAKIETGEIIFNKDETKIIRKIYLAKQEGRVAESIWFGSEVGTTREATAFLKEMFDESPFDTPKPIQLIDRILKIGGSNKSIILDFFAGSGTTLHATMQLNAEDGGSRQCILVTNNENNIAEEVCYERNKRVIQGYANSKGQWVEGLPGNNLRYYRTEFVGSAKTTKNKKQLTRLATELLCIKEDIYSETGQIAGFVFNTKTARCFCDSDKYMLVIYDEELIEELIPVITAIQSRHKIKIYVFAPGQYPFTEEFEEVLDKIELCALPDAIYKAYTGILPKKTVSRLSAEGNQPAENQASTEVDLFTANTPEA